ncbi:MAG: hypothetical protein C4558_01925, partial [Dehalococcoidia bacterium]
MFGFEEVNEQTVRGELRDARRQRETLTVERDSLRSASRTDWSVDGAALKRAYAGVARRLDDADEDRHEQVLESLQISVSATREEATVEGVLPIEPPAFLIKSWGLSPL